MNSFAAATPTRHGGAEQSCGSDGVSCGTGARTCGGGTVHRGSGERNRGSMTGSCGGGAVTCGGAERTDVNVNVAVSNGTENAHIAIDGM